MRELAVEAGVSFATPFNQFGSKAAIVLALSADRIAAMNARIAASPSASGAAARVLAATRVAASVMLEQPTVNRAVMGALGAPMECPGDVWARSRALWAKALGDGSGLTDPTLARAVLPDQLAIVFRGVLSFWTSGEIADGDLEAGACAAAAIALFGFSKDPGERQVLAGLMVAQPDTPSGSNSPE